MTSFSQYCVQAYTFTETSTKLLLVTLVPFLSLKVWILSPRRRLDVSQGLINLTDTFQGAIDRLASENSVNPRRSWPSWIDTDIRPMMPKRDAMGRAIEVGTTIFRQVPRNDKIWRGADWGFALCIRARLHWRNSGQQKEMSVRKCESSD